MTLRAGSAIGCMGERDSALEPVATAASSRAPDATRARSPQEAASDAKAVIAPPATSTRRM
jgi:hypothetical protein